MFKLAAIATLAYLGLAGPQDEDPAPAFPNIDDGSHVGCQLSVHYPGRSCGQLWDRFTTMINAFHNEDPG